MGWAARRVVALRGRLVPAPVIAWLDRRYARAQLRAERAELLGDPAFLESLRQMRAGEAVRRSPRGGEAGGED